MSPRQGIRVCYTCKTPITAKFHRRWVCRECLNAETRARRRRNIDKFKVYEKNARVKNKVTWMTRQHEREDIVRAAKDKSCADCGVWYPYYVMDFDHVRGTKVDIVGHVKGGSIQRLMLEISKCEVVCANCHRIRTENRRRESERDKV